MFQGRKLQSLTCLCLIAVANLAWPSLLSPVDEGNTHTTVTPVDRLFEQASFWQSRSRGDLARATLMRVLKSVPNHPNALYQMGSSYAAEGNIQQAKVAYNQLLNAQPQSSLLPLLLSQISTGTFDQNRLQTARQLVAEDRSDEAISEYEILLAGRDLAGPVGLEYLHTLSGQPDRREEAINILRTMQGAKQNPNVTFTLGQVLTYDEATRREGITLLQSMGQQEHWRAKTAEPLRKALLWLNATENDDEFFLAYLQAHPGDEEITARSRELNQVIDPSSYEGKLMAGFRSLRNGKVRQAQSLFQTASQTESENAEALAGLGLTYLREGKLESARKSFLSAFNKDQSLRSAYANAYRSVEFWTTHQTISRSIGHDPQAKLLARVSDMKPVTQADYREQLFLKAEIMERGNQPQQAAAVYQELQEQDPGNIRAVRGQLRLAMSEEDYPKLEMLLAQHEGLFNTSNTQSLQLDYLRARAFLREKQGNKKGALNDLMAALPLDPHNPWVHLDLAKLLMATERQGEAKQLMSSLENLGENQPSSAHALALFHASLENWDQALKQTSLVSTEQKTPELLELEQDIEFRVAIREAVQLGKIRGGQYGRESLISLYETSKNSSDRAALIISALHEIEEPRVAVAMIEQQIQQSASQPTPAMMSYAHYLLEWKQFDLLQTILGILEERSDLSTKEILALADLKNQTLLAYADYKLEAGDFSTALKSYQSVLDADPTNSQALRSLAGLLQSRGYFVESLNTYQKALTIQPDDLWSVKGAVGAALQANDIKSARTILDAAFDQLPGEPDLYELLSQVAQSAGETKLALESISYAQSLRAAKGKQQNSFQERF